jgi:hypothetical protein
MSLLTAFRSALAPGLIAGVVTIFTSWLWMGVIFHRYQRLTPDTWRLENNFSYLLSSVIHFFACVFLATLFRLTASGGSGFFAMGMEGALRFGALVWMAIAAPLAIDAAIYIKLDSRVVVGQLLDWLTTSLIACFLTAWWTGS